MNDISCLAITIDDIAVICKTAHRCVTILEKEFDVLSRLPRHRHSVGLFVKAREKGRDLTQSYDKSPYTNRNVKRAK